MSDTNPLPKSKDPRRTHRLRNVLWNAVGKEELYVETAVRRLPPGSQLLLCSDGLWELIEDHELQAILEATPDPQTACHKLVELAKARGGKDNISAIVVKMPGEATE